MTATEELRRMLDERGVEWYEPTTKPNTTWFPDSFGINCRVKPWGEVLQVKRYGLTPEQAIAATLGGGECEIVYRDGGWYCTECKEAVGCDDPWCESYINGNVVEMWSFCPACGRRLKR